MCVCGVYACACACGCVHARARAHVFGVCAHVHDCMRACVCVKHLVQYKELKPSRVHYNCTLLLTEFTVCP